MRLRYGMNPQQRPASVTPVVAGRSPVAVVHGEPSYINLLDALHAWQLVKAAAAALGRPAATSFKHVSSAGAAVAGEIDEVMAATYRVDAADTGPLTSAYLRARDADPRSSYGDFVAVSEPVDDEFAEVLARLVSDGIIAPGYAPGVVGKLSAKKHGRFLVLAADPEYRPAAKEHREVYGLRFTQRRDDRALSRADLANVVCGTLPAEAVDDLLLGLIVLRYTQSNSVAYLRDGMALGIGAGQQSRIGCTRLAGAKTDTWWLRRHPRARALTLDTAGRVQDCVNRQIRFVEDDFDVDELAGVASEGSDLSPLRPDERREWLARLDGVSLVSDGAIPFRDNIDHASRHGVRHVAEPGGSVRSDEVRVACQEYGMALAHTGIRLFHH